MIMKRKEKPLRGTRRQWANERRCVFDVFFSRVSTIIVCRRVLDSGLYYRPQSNTLKSFHFYRDGVTYRVPNACQNPCFVRSAKSSRYEYNNRCCRTSTTFGAGAVRNEIFVSIHVVYIQSHVDSFNGRDFVFYERDKSKINRIRALVIPLSIALCIITNLNRRLHGIHTKHITIFHRITIRYELTSYSSNRKSR